LRKRNIKKYGVEWTSQRQDVIEKRKSTMMERYGVEHPLQHKEFLDKMISSSYMQYPYKLGNRTVSLQGYEGSALNWLLRNTTILPGEIICGDSSLIPSIPYLYRGKRRVYHPDFYVPSRNLLVEVKSTYSYTYALRMNKAKAKASKAAGYNFKFLVMNNDGTRAERKDHYGRR
jgi:hypothetical protein